MAVTAQLNVRMDPAVKAAGDVALARAGYTPAEFIRALWERFAQSPQDCEDIVQGLAFGQPAPLADTRLFDDVNASFVRMCETCGINPQEYVPLCDDDLDEEVIAYRYERERERGVTW